MCCAYLGQGLVECSACRHLGELPDEHGGVAGWRQLKGELQGKQVAFRAFCNQGTYQITQLLVSLQPLVPAHRSGRFGEKSQPSPRPACIPPPHPRLTTPQVSEWGGAEASCPPCHTLGRGP